MTYHTYWGLPACVVALALNGCSGIAPRAASPDIEPPPWNSLEMMMMNTEIVSVDPHDVFAANITAERSHESARRGRAIFRAHLGVLPVADAGDSVIAAHQTAIPMRYIFMLNLPDWSC